MKRVKIAMLAVAAIGGLGTAVANSTANFFYVQTAPNVYERITDVEYLNGICETQAATFCGYEVAPADATEAQISSSTLATLLAQDKAEGSRENKIWVP